MMEQRSIQQEAIRVLVPRVTAGRKASLAVTQAVCRAVQLLECLAKGGREGLGITELSQELGFPKSTVHRILATLAHEGYVIQVVPTGRYDLTLKVLELSALVQRRMRLPYQARLHLLQLMASTDEAVTLAAVEGRRLLVIDRVDRPERMNPGSDIGLHFAWHCTAAGKAILSTLAPAGVEALLGRKALESFTPHTLTSREALFMDLAEAARLGYAVDREECRLGVKGVAAPIRDRAGEAIAAVEVDVPIVRLTEARLTVLGQGVKEAAERISSGLGFRRRESL